MQNENKLRVGEEARSNSASGSKKIADEREQRGEKEIGATGWMDGRMTRVRVWMSAECASTERACSVFSLSLPHAELLPAMRLSSSAQKHSTILNNGICKLLGNA